MKYIKTFENKISDIINKVKSGEVKYIKVIGKNNIYNLIIYVNYQKEDSTHYSVFKLKYIYLDNENNNEINTVQLEEKSFITLLKNGSFTTANKNEIEYIKTIINTNTYNL